MNTSGSMYKFGEFTSLQASIWNIITDEEEDDLKRMMKDIHARFPGHNIVITISVSDERRKQQ